MTGLAHIGGIDVACGQTVTAGVGTTAIHLGMIHRCDGRPGGYRMAGFADIGGIDVASG